MKHLGLYGTVGLLVMLAGCQMWHQASTNIAHEYRRYMDQGRTFRQLDEEALAAWSQHCRELPQPPNPDYQTGFITGYVQYADAGGTGKSPPIAPPRYWRADMRNPAGQTAGREWMNGYAAGSSAAEGRRPGMVVVSNSVVAPPVTWPPVLPPPPAEPSEAILPRQPQVTEEPPLESPESNETLPGI